MPMTTAWRKLRFLQNVNGRRASLGVLAVVPILASLNVNLQGPDTRLVTGVVGALTTILEYGELEVPINLMRAFWAALAYYISSLLLTLSFPPHLVPEDEWKSSSRASSLRKKILSKKPNISDQQLTEEILEVHNSSSADVLTFRSTIWLVSAISLLVSVYITVIVITANIQKILGSCPVSKILIWGAESC